MGINNFSKEKLIQEVLTLDLLDAIILCQKEKEWAKDVRTKDRDLKIRLLCYEDFAREIEFFLSSGMMPAGVRGADFELIKRLAKSLVERKFLKPEILLSFNQM